MLNNLNEKDKRTIKLGGIGAAALIVLIFGAQGYSNWSNKKTDYSIKSRNLESLNITETAHARMLSAVPNFVMPKDEQTQKTDFRDSLSTLFDELGIRTADPLQEVAASKSKPLSGYGLLCLRTKGTCRFEQILNLLAALKNNPYLVGVEEFNFQCDPQNPQQVTFSIELSTLTYNKRVKS